jgi:homoserine acetyltransferase
MRNMSWFNNRVVSKCPNPACARPFQVNRFSTRLSPSLELGKMSCPHCGLALMGDSNAVFLTHALSSDQEAAYSNSANANA